MKVVLQENVRGLGQKGEVKEVKDGYAMNFLIPQGKVVAASEGNVKQAELEQEKTKEIREKEIVEAKKLAEKIKGKKITIQVKAQDNKLFGAITEKEIVTAIKDAGENVGLGEVILNEKIKKTDEYPIKIDWNNGVDTEIILVVEALKK